MWTPEDHALVGDFGAGQAMSDDQYRLLLSLIPPARPGGRPRRTDMPRLLDGLFYVVRTGCQCATCRRPRPFHHSRQHMAIFARSSRQACGRAYTTISSSCRARSKASVNLGSALAFLDDLVLEHFRLIRPFFEEGVSLTTIAATRGVILGPFGLG